jgi:hypothetical protein
MKQIAPTWNSLHKAWPFYRGTYKIYDCKKDVEGVAEYDGFDFFNAQWEPMLTGSLMYTENRISHWKGIGES